MKLFKCSNITIIEQLLPMYLVVEHSAPPTPIAWWCRMPDKLFTVCRQPSFPDCCTSRVEQSCL